MFWCFVVGGLEIRLQVARVVWPYMLSIGLAYFITQCLYPGIETEIVSCRYGSWMPVILIAIFNASDLLGKVSKCQSLSLSVNVNMVSELTTHFVVLF